MDKLREIYNKELEIISETISYLNQLIDENEYIESHMEELNNQLLVQIELRAKIQKHLKNI